MLKVGFISLGCAKNLVDTELMLGLLTKSNYIVTDSPEEADILIVNTCGFIDSAKEESISTILQMAEFKRNGKCKGLIVAGCLGQRYQQELLDELPEIDAILGTGAWHLIVDAINELMAGRRVLLIKDNDTIYDEKMPRVLVTPQYSAYVKIAEGCNNCCSYCIIPKIRGKFRSRTIDSIKAEVRMLALQGVKEINLIAQDTTSYGRDLYGVPRLTSLLQELVKNEEIRWIRLMYCYPVHFTDELIELISRESKICKYIDLPLQHINNDILKMMNRQDTRQTIEQLLIKLRKQIPGVAIRTTFIVGFPGETDEQFNELKQFMLETKFDHAGVFIYSQEEDTVAGLMPNQIAEEVKQERYHDLMSLQSQISEEINRSLENSVLDVLIEGKNQEHNNIVYGRSYREAPDVDGRIYIENANNLSAGKFVKARVVQGFAYDLVAEKLI